jgi:hypothetical protein
MPKRTDIQSILIIGAGPIVIGQACEFDYSGTQAVKALKDEGYRVVLVNSNPATIMTDPEIADATYIEPITPEIVAKIIDKERPDALLPIGEPIPPPNPPPIPPPVPRRSSMLLLCRRPRQRTAVPPQPRAREQDTPCFAQRRRLTAIGRKSRRCRALAVALAGAGDILAPACYDGCGDTASTVPPALFAGVRTRFPSWQSPVRH